MILVHPIKDGGQSFAPCVYGYAITVRKAQGATLGKVVLYVDLVKPNPHGLAYVGGSRVRSVSGLYYVGTMRRSDWLPVGGPGEPIEQEARGVLSEDDASDDEGAFMEEEADELSEAGQDS